MRGYKVVAGDPSNGNILDRAEVGPYTSRVEAERAATALVSSARGWRTIQVETVALDDEAR